MNLTPKSEELKVFISYAREDHEVAYKIYDDLKNRGLSPWIDKEHILPGVNWMQIISKSIKESNYFIALLSSNSVSKRGYVQKELKIALDLLDEFPPEDIFLIPVRIDECKPVHEKIQYLHWANLFPSYEEGINQILKVLLNDRKFFTYNQTKELILNQLPDPDDRYLEDDVIKHIFKLPHNLPTLINWVGRADEVQNLKAKIFNSDSQSIEITGGALGVIGSAGIGKTMLASKLLNELSKENTPFTISAWVSMRPDLGTNRPPNFHIVTDLILFTLSENTITKAATAKDDFHKKTERILSILKKKSCLIVFDNVESVLRTEKSYYAGYFEPEFNDYAH
ncbi:protein containing Toll-Interleukin receptor, partial [Candidatus Magnetomorum sp. HK-1]